MRTTGEYSIGWEPDWHLRVRMLGSILLLIVFPFLFVITLEWALSTIVPAVTFVPTGVTIDLDFVIDRRFLAVAVVAGLVAQYSYGDTLALRSLDARILEDTEQPTLQAIVRRLSQQADLPEPRLAIIDTSAPNAFATGRSPSNATIVVTTGLLETLPEDEIEAVVAHELAHVKNRDMTVMTVAYLLPILTYLVATLFWIGSFLLYRLLGQYREFAADRASAQLTGDPLALASALERIDDGLSAAPDSDLRDLDGGVEPLYVASLEYTNFTDEGDDGLLSKDLFPETHPDTRERIQQLQALYANLEGQSARSMRS